MKKRLQICLLILAFMPVLVLAQKFSWVQQAGSTTGQDYFSSAASNRQGNVLFGGEFTGTISFGSNNYTASGAKDLVLMVYDSTGNPVWSSARQFVSTGGTELIADAAFDSVNNRYYVTGMLSGGVSVSAQTGTYNNSGSFFLARITAAGVADILFPVLNTSRSEGTGIAVDNNGNVFVCGNFRDSITLGSATLYSDGGQDAFVVKLNNVGVVQFVKHIRGTGDEVARGIALSGSEAYVVGNFNRPVYFTPTDSLVPNTYGLNNVFLARFQSSTMVLNNTLRVAYASTGEANAISLDVDRTTGRAAITGYYTGILNTGSHSRTSAGGRDMFVSVVRPVPFSVDWAKSYGGNLDETGVRVRIGEALRNIFVYGKYNSLQFYFGTDTLSQTASGDHFIMTWNALGLELGAVGGTMTFSSDQIIAQSMDIDRRKMFIGGGFRGRANFGTQGIRQSLTSFDAYGAQIDPARIYCKINSALSLSPNLIPSGSLHMLCDHDTGVALAAQHPNYQYAWYNGSTLVAGQSTPFLMVTDTGDFHVVITDTMKKCSVHSDTLLLRIYPLPTVTILDTAVCSGSPSFAIVGYSPAGGVFSGSGITGNVFNPGILQPDTYRIAYAVTASTTCTGRDTADFIIHPRPNLIYTQIPSFCDNSTPEYLSFVQTQNVLRDSFYTTIPGQISNDTLYPALLITGTFNAVRYFVLDSNFCSKDTAFNIYVEPKPALTHVALIPHCQNEGMLTLSGGNPTVGQGAFYSGRGVQSGAGQFHTDSAGAGLFDIQYHFVKTVTIGSQVLQCADSILVPMLIDTVPNVAFTFIDTVCEGMQDFALKGGLPVTGGLGIYSGTAVSSGRFFSPIQAGIGQFIVEYLFTDFNNCSHKATDTVFVRSRPAVALPFVGNYCENEYPVLLNGGTPAGGDYYYQSLLLTGSVFNPAVFNIGTDTLRYVFTDVFGCDNEARAAFTIVRKPFVFFPGTTFLNPICANSPEVDLIAFGDTVITPPPSAGGIFSFTLTDSITRFMPSDFIGVDSTVISKTLYYHYRDGVTGCADTVGRQLNIYPAPKAAIVSRGYTCANRTDTLDATGGLTYKWNTGDFVRRLPFRADTPTTFSVTVTNAYLCADSAQFKVDVRKGNQLTARRDSVTTKKNKDIYFDPVERLYSADTVAFIGTFTVLSRPAHYLEYSVTSGVSADFNSRIYYNPEKDFRRLDSLTYRICNIECPDLCDTNIVVINVLGDPYDFIPNGFSPNDDGMNDTWVVPGIEAFTGNELFIYNRWGDLVFHASPYLNDWAGQTNKGIGGGKKVGDGTYFYVLVTNDGDPIKGTIEMKSK